MSSFIDLLIKEQKKLETLQKLHPEPMLEFSIIGHFLKEARSRTVDDILQNGSALSSELKTQCTQIYEQIIQRKSDASSSESLIERWVERASLPEHGYKTAYGHGIFNKRLFNKMGSYWVIKPGHYEDVKPTLWESFAFVVKEETWYVSEEVHEIGWGN